MQCLLKIKELTGHSQSHTVVLPGHGLSLSKLDDPATPKITISLPDPYVDALDSIANQAKCSRTEIIRRAIRQHIEDSEDLSVSAERLQDPGDPALPWDRIKNDLLE